MDCETFTRSHRRVRCKRWNKCHELRVCLCEVDPKTIPPPQPKRTHATKLPWTDRRQQILKLAEHETITAQTLMHHVRANRGTVFRWINRLINENKFILHTKAITGGPPKDRRPAIYAIKKH